ncbi:MAG: signal peptidase I [Bacillota bacterium]|nr:signal peptidase I [Bacillota bacterium]
MPGGGRGSGHAVTTGARRAAREIAETIIIAVILAFIVRWFVVETFVVIGPSMEPTLNDMERLFVNKLVYRLHDPERGDIIVFAYPRDPSRDFIKRVIGVPGETVELRDGRIFVDDKFIPERVVVFPDHQSTYGPVEVPAGHVFVLGDNRRNSEDSRYFGFVPFGNIRGKALLMYWPLRRFGLPQ